MQIDTSQSYNIPMKRLIMLLCYTIGWLCAYSQSQDSITQSADSATWERAQKLLDNKHYKQAAQIYSDLIDWTRAQHAEINSEKVEDLRKEYSIDELKLQENIEKNNFLRILTIITVSLLLFGVVCCFYLRWEKRKLQLVKKELEKATELEKVSMRNKSIFLSNMSHEIRTPLNALSGFAELLTETDIDNETRKQCYEIIQLNSDLLLKLINDVVDISCLDISKLSFHIEKYNAIELCQNVIQTVSAIKTTSANLSFETNLTALTLDTDPSRLQQVLINLLVNATKFTKDGRITLFVEKINSETAEFSVTDTGCGIPLEQQTNLFNRFEKLNEKEQGTGLGLSICQLIVKRLNGNIWIDPLYTRGARFVFTHPLTQKTKR